MGLEGGGEGGQGFRSEFFGDFIKKTNLIEVFCCQSTQRTAFVVSDARLKFHKTFSDKQRFIS